MPPLGEIVHVQRGAVRRVASRGPTQGDDVLVRFWRRRARAWTDPEAVSPGTIIGPASGAAADEARAAPLAWDTPEDSPEVAAPTEFSTEAIFAELGSIMALVQDQRRRVERALEDHPEDKPPPRDVTHALEKLVHMGSALSKEFRQLQKVVAAEEMTAGEARQTLIDAGWTPPKGDR